MRSMAAKRFIDGGWPKPSDEAWRFTNLNKLSARDFAPVVAGSNADTNNLPKGARVVIVNGVIDMSLSTAMPKGAELVMLGDDSGLASLLDDDRLLEHSVACFSLAVLASGFGLRFTGIVTEPVHLVYRNSGDDTSSHPVGVVMIEDHATATVLEHHSGDGEGLSAPILVFDIGKGASFTHARVQVEGASRHHLAVSVMNIAEAGRYHGLSVQTGGVLSRNENHIALKGVDIDLTLTTIYLAKDDQVMDVTAVVDHQMPNCISRQIVRGVLDDGAKGIFQGKVIVARDAQKTDGNQMSRALLLSRKCEADAKPELEIYADDVVCSHGATVGELDDDHLFYLMSRGIPKPDARQMLIEAFLSDVLDDIDDSKMKNHGQPTIDAWLTVLKGS